MTESHPTPASRFRPFQFSLLELLAAITLCAGVFALPCPVEGKIIVLSAAACLWSLVRIVGRRARTIHDAMILLCSLFVLALTSAWCIFAESVDDMLFVPHGARLTDAECRKVTTLRFLVNEQGDGEVDDADVKQLRKCTRLESLILANALISDESMRVVAQLKTLTHLDLDYTQIGDSGLEFLKTSASLELITLTRCKISDMGLAHLRGLHNLQRLDLTETSIGEAGLKHLVQLPQLSDLDLTSTKITDDSIPILAEMKQLESLHLRDTELTSDGISRLKKALPQTKIYSNSD